MVIPLIAFDPLISGVWSVGGTLLMISNPTKIARIKTVRLPISTTTRSDAAAGFSSVVVSAAGTLDSLGLAASASAGDDDVGPEDDDVGPEDDDVGVDDDVGAGSVEDTDDAAILSFPPADSCARTSRECTAKASPENKTSR
jgi:hypothetical protein